VIGRPTACLSFNKRGEKPEISPAVPIPSKGDEDENLIANISILASMEYIQVSNGSG
jgi:hypothetical protein